MNGQRGGQDRSRRHDETDFRRVQSHRDGIQRNDDGEHVPHAVRKEACSQSGIGLALGGVRNVRATLRVICRTHAPKLSRQSAAPLANDRKAR